MKIALGAFLLIPFTMLSARAVEERVFVPERDPALGAKLPEGVLWETKKGWKFEKDQLVFFNPNQNKNGNRYVIWRDYHFEINESDVVIFDTRPFGVTLKASRKQVDEDGKPLTDEKVMDQLHDQAQDIRIVREPRPVIIHEYPPYYYSPFIFHWHFGRRHCR